MDRPRRIADKAPLAPEKRQKGAGVAECAPSGETPAHRAVDVPLCIVTVPVDPSRTSLNQRLHWRQRAERGRYAKGAARMAWRKAGAPRAPGPVRVEVIVRRGRLLDTDNAWTGLKPVCDQLFNSRRDAQGEGITPSDSPAWVEMTVRQETGKQWRGREECEFRVYARGGGR